MVSDVGHSDMLRHPLDKPLEIGFSSDDSGLCVPGVWRSMASGGCRSTEDSREPIYAYGGWSEKTDVNK